MTDTYHNYVNGAWTPAAGGNLYENANPADSRELVSVHGRSGRAEAFAALEAAAAAFPAWADLPAPARGDYLFRVATLIRQRADAIARDFTREEGKTLAEAKGETLRAAQIFEFFAGEARRFGGRTFQADAAGTFLFTRREPLGVVALITPWNFPVAIPAWKLAPALVAGNTVVMKPATNTPLTAVRLFECLAEAGLPAGVANLVFGPGREIGAVFAEEAVVKAISFTGSNVVGKALLAAARDRLVKVQLELGGKNPLIFAPDGDVERAVAYAVEGAFGSTGQKCTATGRCLVPRAKENEFLDKVAAAAQAVVVGDGLKAGVRVGPLVEEAALKRVSAYVDDAERQGATILCGGPATGPAYEYGYFYLPTVLAGVTRTMTVWNDEIFGPVLPVMAYDDVDEAIAIANDTPYGLAASVVTNDLRVAQEFTRRIQAGLVHVNSPTTGASCHVPFGGYKESSSGTREQGQEALEFFTQWKTAYWDF